MNRSHLQWIKVGLLALLVVNLDLAAAPAPDVVAPVAGALPAPRTPVPGPAPRINGPTIFGVRPNSPFLYAIPVTGERPVSFAVTGLPEGLKLDPATGRITGTLAQPGTYPVTISVKSRVGTAQKPFRIVVGEDIALTPPMGWNSYNVWSLGINQERTLAAARAMIASGLDRHGWAYVNMDDGWQGKRGGPSNAMQADANRFTDIKQMCADIHDLGLKVGIYHTPWVESYGGRPGGTSEDSTGLWSPKQQWPGKHESNKKVLPRAIGRYSFSAADARQFADWGIDYLKYDWAPVEVPETREIADALRASGRDIVLSISNNHTKSLFAGIQEVAPLAQAWRTTGDINDSWGSVNGIGFNQDKWAPFARPGHWNDPDMLVVGYVGWGKPRPTKLTPDEQYTHVSLWALLSAPLLIGADMEKLDAFTLGLLTNDEVIEVNQDALGKQATRVAGNKGDLVVYAKPLEDGSWAVGLFNLGATEATVSVKWSDLGLNGPQAVRDLWRQKELGSQGGGYSVKVASHGAELVRVGRPLSRYRDQQSGRHSPVGTISPRTLR